MVCSREGFIFTVSDLQHLQASNFSGNLRGGEAGVDNSVDGGGGGLEGGGGGEGLVVVVNVVSGGGGEAGGPPVMQSSQYNY